MRLWLPVIVSFVIQVPAAVFVLGHAGPMGFGPRPGPGSTVGLLGIGLALIGPLALIGARRFPGPVVAIVAAAASADFLFNPHPGPPYAALGFAIILGIIRGARIWVFSAVAAAWVLCVLVASLVGPQPAPFQIAGLTIGILICLGIGEGIRSRRERIRTMRQATTRRRLDAAQQERVRIARELHDVLAHSLSQINVQAGVGLHLIDKKPEKAAEALASIKETSKTALDEVRGVLGLLRDDSGDPGAPLIPQADLSMLPGLVDRVGRDGLAVTLENRIEAPPPAAVQMALYRLVQESITNVVRHADATELTIRLTQEAGEYVLDVVDNGLGAPAGTAENTTGSGILGMRERAELLGGTLTVGTSDSGRGFHVRASIPMRGTP